MLSVYDRDFKATILKFINQSENYSKIKKFKLAPFAA